MIEAKLMNLSSAADFLGNGAIEVPEFESEILDLVRRSTVVLQRIKQKPATGHPHRYFEQTAIAQAAATDPRAMTHTPTGPTRVERPAFIKAVTAQTNISMFDREVTEQQGQFAQVIATDMADIVSAIEIKRAKMFWTGSDTSLSAPTELEWMGALAQITAQSEVAEGASIVDVIKTEVAEMMADETRTVMPTAIFLNPLLIDMIEKEEKANHREMGTVDIVAGQTVKAISTQAGVLPLIPDPYMPQDTTAKYGFTAPAAGKRRLYAVIMTESLVEIPVISGREFNPNPRMFQLGLLGDLGGQYVGVKFDTLIVKAASYAHRVVGVLRAV